jgi:G3E family GTPase
MGTEPSHADADEGARRTPLIVVSGVHEDHVDATARALLAEDPAGTVVVHHDLREVAREVVRRRVRQGDAEQVTPVELAHGCVSCTLREDLLPLLRRLASAPGVNRIVVRLDPALEPETICWAIRHVLVDDRTVQADVQLEAVVTAVDVPSWLADASGDEPLVERGIAGSVDDERTVAQLAVGQVEFADAIVLAGENEDRWNQVRTEAVISRLTPNAPLAWLNRLNVAKLLERVPDTARRGEVDGPHGPLLRGQPSLEYDAGVAVVLFDERRPFHPQRLHDALEVLLDGVVRARGRAWVASQPDVALWLESAGAGLAIGHAGPWLAALPQDAWADVEPERQVKASLNWDTYYGDRMQELVVIAHEANPRDITRALREAVLTDDELAAGEAEWLTYPDPFGEWHTDPCADSDGSHEVPDAASESGNH